MKILYIDLDSLRPDHMGCYGYHRNTTPNIDRIAEKAVRFENFYCSDAPCLPSRTALLSGQFGIHTGVVGHGDTTADMRIEGVGRGFTNVLDGTLPGFLRWAPELKDDKYRATTISPFAERHGIWSFNAGFSEVHNTGGLGVEPAEDVTPTALKWVADHANEENWFLHVNYWDIHGPYRTPDDFVNPFENEPLADWITPEILEKHRQMIGPKGAREVGGMFSNKGWPDYPKYPDEIKDMDDLRAMFDGYDCGIRYADEHVGQIFKAFEEQGVLDDLMIIISCDHAENMGELGIYGEHGTADNCTHRIPMIVRMPGDKEARVDTGLHYNIDLAPTLAELLGAEPSKQWDGESFAAAITENKDCGRDFLVLSQCAHVCQRSVRWDDWIYIRTYHCGYHLFPEEMLFNIKDDPHEQNNLAGERNDLCKDAVYKLNQWHDDMMKTMHISCDVDPLWTVMKEGGPHHAKGRLAEYCNYLEQTERGWAIPELKRRYPGEFK